MNKFEFGDRVLCNWQGRQFEAVFVAFWEEEGNPGWGWIEVLEENETSTTDVGCDCVKPIPHPDTERMEWLYRNLLSKNVFGQDRQIQTADDLRDAIDTERYRRENPDPSAFE